jgi:TPR repeat protein
MDIIEKKYNFVFKHDVDEKLIINLFDKGKIVKDNDDDKYLYYVGLWHEVKFISRIHDIDKFYFKRSAEKGNINSMLKLAEREIKYDCTEKKINNAEKYLLNAFEKEKDNEDVLLALGNFYNEIKYDKNKLREFYLMAIEKGNIEAMWKLAHDYERYSEKEETIKYYLMAIEKGSIHAMYNLARYYFENKENDEEAVKYTLMLIKEKNREAMELSTIYLTDEKYHDMVIKAYEYAIEQKCGIAVVYLGHYYILCGNHDKGYKYLIEFNHRHEKYSDLEYYERVQLLYMYIDFFLAEYYKKIGKYELMKEHYISIIKSERYQREGDLWFRAIFCLVDYYQEIEIDNYKMKYFLSLAIDNGSEKALEMLIEYYDDFREKFDYGMFDRVELFIKGNTLDKIENYLDAYDIELIYKHNIKGFDFDSSFDILTIDGESDSRSVYKKSPYFYCVVENGIMKYYRKIVCEKCLDRDKDDSDD